MNIAKTVYIELCSHGSHYCVISYINKIKSANK